jgi:hypothetical protein
MARKDPQTNLRLPIERHRILEAAAFVEEAGTPTKLAERIIDEAIDRYARMPSVQKAIEARTQHADEASTRVTQVPREVRRRRKT